MGHIYYKQELGYSLIFYYINQSTHRIEGMYAEHKNDNMISLRRNIDTSMWTDVETNELAQELIRTSVVISQEEYETAVEIINAMVDSNYWLSSEDKIGSCIANNKKEVVTETVIC